MKVFGAIIKKNLIERYRTMKNAIKTNAFSGFLSLLSGAIFLALFVIILIQVVSAYSSVMYDGIKDPFSRQKELLTIFYTLIMIVIIFSSLKQFNKFLFYNDDLKIYVTLPIKMSSLYASIVLSIYIKQIVMTLIYTLVINLVFVNVAGLSENLIYYSILVAFLLPAISIAIASIIAVPVYYLQTMLRNKYIFSVICITALLGVGFWIYSQILDIFSDMLFTGEIKFFFSKKVMDFIIALSNSLYPAVYCANFSLGIEIGKNIGIVLGITLGSLIIGALMINSLLVGIIKNKLQPVQKVWFKKTYTFNPRCKFLTLMHKELLTTLRTPSYVFQYFSTALIMPLMTVFSIKLIEEFTWNLIGINCQFEIAIFAVFIFSMLTNTYCATNISRDGDSFFTIKSYPISPKQYVMTKIIFCTIISFISTLITCIVIGATGYVSAVQAVFVCISSWAFGLSQICFATHLDLANPHFPKEDNGEVKENNSTSSLVSILGLIVSIFVGGAGLVMHIVSALKGKVLSDMYVYLITGVVSVMLCLISSICLWVSIDKLFNRIQEGV